MVGCSMSRSSRGLNTSHDWLGDSRKVGAGAITQDPSEHMDSMSLTEFTRLLHSDEDSVMIKDSDNHNELVELMDTAFVVGSNGLLWVCVLLQYNTLMKRSGHKL